MFHLTFFTFISNKVYFGTIHIIHIESMKLTSSGSGTSRVVPCGALIAIRVSFCHFELYTLTYVTTKYKNET